jgi:AGZA family xanthine/uracil permease-like MFS transporter
MLKEYFEFENRRTSLQVEIVAGVTTFLTMAYIVFVNPDILSGAGMDKEALIAVTCIVSAVATIVTGLFGKAPIAMAPGMGLNTFFAVTLVQQEHVAWQTALGAVFVSGLFFLILTLIGLRKKLVEAIPGGLIAAIAVGIGLFIMLIGLGQTGLSLVLRGPRTFFAIGDLTQPTLWIGLLGLAVMVVLTLLRVTGSLLAGIFVATVVAALLGHIGKPTAWVSTQWPVAKLALRLDVLGALKISLLANVFTLMFIDLFDSIGTLVACSEKAGMKDEKGQIKGLDRLLSIDAIATMFGAVMGTSTTTAYVESAAGIEQGGRTGLTSIITGLLFILALFFVPVIGIVPGYATAPALIMVGVFMMTELRKINLRKVDELIPSLIIIVMIAVSYQISMGLAFGFVTFVILKLLLGRYREVRPVMWLIAAMSLAFIIIRLPVLLHAIRGGQE